MRRHCMKIFHYCAEVLKDIPIFETCSDTEALKPQRFTEGAIYNDWDGMSADLIMDEEFEDDLMGSVEFYDDDDEVNEEMVYEPEVTQEDIDYYFLQSDEADESRWVKEHRLFTRNKDDEKYNQIVQELVAMNQKTWNRLPIMADDLKRYDRAKKF